ncbi:MAG: hypothetical protein ACOYMN_24035 [Roseimicrobium sp.]
MSLHNYTPDAASRRDSAVRENGVAWSYVYNSRSEVTGGAKAAPNGTANPGHTFGYTYDGLGNRTGTSEDAPQGLVSLAWQAGATNALVSREHAPSRWVMGRAYPQATVTVNGKAATRESNGEFRAGIAADGAPGADWEPVEVRAVLAGAGMNGGDITVKRHGHFWFVAAPESFTYDDDGNLTSDGCWTYAWDAENRLTGMWHKFQQTYLDS